VQIASKPDCTRHKDAGFFKKNNLTLAAPPIGVIVFPGSDTVENLADKARKMGNPVWSFTKGGA
jgi:hypothetical protein